MKQFDIKEELENLVGNSLTGFALFQDGDYDKAAAEMAKALEIKESLIKRFNELEEYKFMYEELQK